MPRVWRFTLRAISAVPVVATRTATPPVPRISGSSRLSAAVTFLTLSPADTRAGTDPSGAVTGTVAWTSWPSGPCTLSV